MTERRNKLENLESGSDTSVGNLCSNQENVAEEKTKSKLNRNWCMIFTMRILLICRIDSNKLMHDFQAKPKQAFKTLLYKIGFIIWCFVIFFSLLSLLGINVNPLKSLVNSSGRVLSTTSTNNIVSSDITSNALSSIRDVFGSNMNNIDNNSENESKDKQEEEEEEIPQQIIPTSNNKKFTKKMERDLSCDELDCQKKCREKAKPKCLKSKSCMSEREKICKKRCRKSRCEQRCKDEPKLGYVEREQKMETCKEGCVGSTAAHNKCIKKCHSEFKPCKQRCHDTASKFVCDKIVTPTEPVITETQSIDIDMDDEDTSDMDDDDNSDDSNTSKSIKMKSVKSVSNSDDDDDELL